MVGRRRRRKWAKRAEDVTRSLFDEEASAGTAPVPEAADDEDAEEAPPAAELFAAEVSAVAIERSEVQTPTLPASVVESAPELEVPGWALEKQAEAAVAEVQASGGETQASRGETQASRGETQATHDEFAEATPPTTEAPAPTHDRFSEARELVAQGRIDEAIALYRDIVIDQPQSLTARNNLALRYDGTGQHERALEHFESARSIEPDNVEVMSNLSAALISLGRFDDAERELRRAMKLQLENVEVRANMGILYFRRGQYVQSENELRWVCERDPNHAAAHFYRGEALNRLGKVDKAIEVLEQAVRLQPRNAKIYHTMGILFDKKQMPAEAAQMYRKMRELSR